MNIYKLTRKSGFDSDPFIGHFGEFIIIAKNEEEAKNFHPSSCVNFETGEYINGWESNCDSWVESPHGVNVELVGKADKKFYGKEIPYLVLDNFDPGCCDHCSMKIDGDDK